MAVAFYHWATIKMIATIDIEQTLGESILVKGIESSAKGLVPSEIE